jgi:RimJ/RimL family protein N-acetyltransferase
MISGMSEQVTLRPVREDDLPIMEKLTGDPDTTGEFAWFGWVDPGRWRRDWAGSQMLGPDGGALIVMRGGERLGFVDWARRLSTPGAYFWEIGIAMLPQARGHGYGTQAHRLLARYLFAHTTAHRIAAATEVGNIAEQKALEKAGFTREGVARAVGWRDGAWRDGVTYSLLRSDPPV